MSIWHVNPQLQAWKCCHSIQKIMLRWKLIVEGTYQMLWTFHEHWIFLALASLALCRMFSVFNSYSTTRVLPMAWTCLYSSTFVLSKLGLCSGCGSFSHSSMQFCLIQVCMQNKLPAISSPSVFHSSMHSICLDTPSNTSSYISFSFMLPLPAYFFSGNIPYKTWPLPTHFPNTFPPLTYSLLYPATPSAHIGLHL